jgi:hypothetical protein
VPDLPALKTKGVPVPYMDIDTIWNDRRVSHFNPLSGSPRREYDKAPSPSALGGLVDQIYRPGAEDTVAHYPLGGKRLYGKGKNGGR